MTTETQEKKIAEYLVSGNKLTQLDALMKFNCLRLSARIYNLKRRGYLIQGENIILQNGKRVKEYFI
jgi:hypothetical protein